MNGGAMRRGFTLLECLIAIALGVVAITTCFAGVRALTAAVATAGRLSLENALMRDAWSQAKHDVDFWTDLDDPADASRQALRASSGGIGLPFTPMATLGGEDAASRAREAAWAADDPETWSYGNTNEFWRGDLRFGRYAISQNLAADLLVEDGATSYGQVHVAHTWLPRRMRLVVAGLGFYGAADYLPPSTIWSWYAPYQGAPPAPWEAETVDGPDGATGPSGAPLMFHRWQSRLCNDDGFQEVPRGLWRLTMGSVFIVADPRRRPEPPLAQLIDEHRRWYRAGYTADADAYGDRSWRAFRAATDQPRDLLPLAPAWWPRFDTVTARFIKNGRFVAMSTLRWTSPLSGETTRLTFASLGTTLRGARRQRLVGGGWADPAQEGLDAP